MYKATLHTKSRKNSNNENPNKPSKYTIASSLIDEEEFKLDHNQVYNDDSKFARQLKKLLRDEEEERKIKKILDLSSYLDQQENIKFVLKLAKPSLNILVKILWEQQLNESRTYLIECISKIGFIMLYNDRDQNKYFDWTMDKIALSCNDYENTKDKNIKVLLLDALLQNLQNENSMRYLKDNINHILNSLKRELELVDTPEIMMKITKIIIYLSNLFPDATLAIFQDIVDILIAWHIDCSQTDDVIEFISSTLVEFRPYWLKEMNFTITLLYQFLEDMESYLDETASKRKEIERIEKISALLKVFNTVVKSISCINDTSYQRLKSVLSNENTDRMIESARRLLVFVCNDSVSNCKCSEFIFGPANYCIELFYEIFDEKMFTLFSLIEDFLIKENKIRLPWSNEVDSSFVRLLTKIIGYYITSNNIDFIRQLFLPEGRLWNYKYSQNSKLIQETLTLYKTIIIAKSIPIVQEVYKTLLNDAESALESLMKITLDDDLASADYKNAETSFLFDLCIFAELGNAKNNLIAMYALSPSLFELLTAKLSACNWQLAENFPNIQFAILNTLYSHCLRHEHFIASSGLFITAKAASADNSSSILTNAPTRDHFKITIEIVTKLIAHPSSSYDMCVLILNWLIEIIDHLSVEYAYIFESVLFSNLYSAIISSAYSNESDICLQCNKILSKTLQKYRKLSESNLLRLIDLCKYYMMSLDDKIKEDYIKLLCMIPINVLNSHNQDLSVLTVNDFSIFSSLVRINYMSSSLETNISVHNFKAIMGYVLAGLEQHSSMYTKTWLERVFYASQHNINYNLEQNEEKNSRQSHLVTLDSVIENHDGLLWFWALWECAQFCVQAKLKTPLGKAQDTFVAIESTIKSYYFQSQQQQQNDQTHNISFDLTQVTLAVHFVEYLEKLIYNAYEGTADSLHPVQKAVKVFFRTNKNTCNEWFWRVRFFLISICLKNSFYELAVRHSFEYINYSIQHNLTMSNEFDQVTVWLVESLIKLRSWQSLIGLHEWLSKTLKKNNLDWILTTSKEAQCRLEAASVEYKKQLKADQSNQLFNRYQAERLFECYFDLHDWKEYMDWYEEYKTISPENTKEIDLNLIKALNSFEFSNSVDVTRACLKESTSGKPIEELIQSVSSKYSTNELERLSYREIYKHIINKRINNITNTPLLSKISSLNMNILNMDESSACNNERLMITQLAYLAQSDQTSSSVPFMKSFKFDSNKHDPKCINTFKLLPSSDDFRLASARLARKQTNYNLASRLITQQLAHIQSKSFNSTNISYESIKQLLNDLLLVKTQSNRILLLECELETAKLLYSLSNKQSNQSDCVLLLINSILRYSASHEDSHPAKAVSNPILQLFINPIQSSNLANNSNDLINEMCSKSILTLFKWLKRADTLLKEINSHLTRTYSSSGETLVESLTSSLTKIVELKKKYSTNENSNDFLKFNSSDLKVNLNGNEMILGDLLDLATMVSPKQAKTWYTMANWCYKWGKRMSDKIQLNKSNSQAINDDEKTILLELLPMHTSNEEKEFIVYLFLRGGYNKLLNKSAEFELCLQQQQQQQQQSDSNDKFTNELRCVLTENCKSLSYDCIENLIDTWKQLTNRVFYFNRIACKAYFTYLNLSAQNLTMNQNEGNISATLRILKILIKYSSELKEELQKGFSKTPTQPWLLAIPQLFCRLNHPEPYVRQCISELLCRIARDYPHLIIYPAVVGSQDGPTKIENVQKATNNNKYNKLSQQNQQAQQQQLQQQQQQQQPKDENATNVDEANVEQENQYDEDEIKQDDEDGGNEIVEQKKDDDDLNVIDEDVDDEEVFEEKKVELKNSYKCLLDALAETNPRMIDEVKLFVHEMRRVTLLREELWLGTLNQIHSDANKRMEQLASEITKIDSNTSLSESEKIKIIKEKYEIIMYPIISVLEHVNEITTQAVSETPNEESFTKEFEFKINEALKHLKNVDLNAFKPHNGWSLFKLLHQLLHQRSQRPKSNSLTMDQISPKLAAIKASTIPIPDKDGHYNSLHSIMPNVYILPTKTKPKKLYFIGSNGKRYTFLFKGLEDLHLDERIMQLLSIVNTMFGKINKSEYPVYNALHYSVTPLGPRSGLISWVENSTALFLLYKKWQQREHSYLATKQQQQQQQQQQIMRPTELFYSKLNPILKEKCIKNFAECRHECPTGVLRQVLEELMRETPNDLLSKELWCHSSTPGNWWKSIQMYSRSTAVMSMIGYVIGLGDRHLDNILVNLTSGEVAHIDYNICFEKGLNLRIPERVPFRMTQNLQHALGISGIEGVFRLSCENVMRILKNGRETLLTLLEAFVYDPLLDWTGSDTGIIASFYGGGQSTIKSNTKQTKEDRRITEKKMTIRLYEIRLIENKTALKLNQDTLMQLVARLESLLQSIYDLKQKSEQKENLIRLHELAKIYLDESLTLHNDKSKLSSQHPVYSLQDRFAKYSQYTSNKENILTKIKGLISSFKLKTSQYCDSFSYVKSLVNLDQTKDWFSQLLSTLNQDLSIGDKIKEPYLLTVDFFQSITQMNYISQCETTYAEMAQFKAKEKSLLSSLFSLVKAKSPILNWLPGDYYNKQILTKLAAFLNQIKDSFDLKTLNNTVVELYKQYRSSVNAQFKLKTPQGVFKKQDLVDLSAKEKIFTRELEEVDKRIVGFQMRKSIIESQNQFGSNLEQDLIGKHDQLEQDMFDFFGQELALNQPYQLVDLHLFEAFGFVMLQFLNDNLQKWILMENASLEAKDQLISLTSIDGDWFLEEMYSLIVNCNHLNGLVTKVFAKYDLLKEMNTLSGVSFRQFLDACDTLNNLFTNLRQLLFEFQFELNEKLIKLSFGNLNDLEFVLNEFESIETDKFLEIISVENFSIETFSQDEESLEKLNEIKLKYNQLLANKTSPLCVQILIELDKLYSKIEFEFDRIVKFLKIHYNSEQYNAQSYFNLVPNLVYLLDDQVLSFYKSLYHVKKIKSIHSCIKICHELYEFTFSGETTTFALSQEQLVLPIKAFISEFVVQMMVGIPTVVLGSLINNLKQVKLPQIRADCINLAIAQSQEYLLSQLNNNQLNTIYIDKFNQILISYDTLWSSIDLLRRIDLSIKFNQTHASLMKNLFETFNWYHDINEFKKSYFNNMTQLVTSLKQNSAQIETTHEKLSSLEQTIYKRLEWASGASPNLGDTLKQFDQARKTQADHFMSDRKAVHSLESLIENWVNLELLRSKNSDVYSENVKFFENILTEIEDAGFLNEEYTQPAINEFEISLMNFQSFKDKKPLNTSIIQEYYKLLIDEIAQQKRLKQKEDKECSSKIDDLIGSTNELKQTLNQHNKVMNDIKPLLKTLNKISENKRLHQYTKIYFQFSDTCQHLVRNLTSDELFSTKPSEALTQLVALKDLVPKIYSELKYLTEDQDKKAEQQELVVEKSEEKKNPAIKINTKPGKVFQECNTHAISVWKRVSQKLDGKDPDLSKVLTVQEQVEYLISQATDVNNLATLYEGWTPWV